MSRRNSRKRRKQRRDQEPQRRDREPTTRGYARSREKDDAARAALEPLDPGERPTAVTVGAVVAAIATVANLLALGFGYDADEPRATFTTLMGAVILVAIAVGMWRARYWAVLGMQTLLAITLILSSLALLTATDWRSAALAVALIAGSGALFWFLVKAMARIQMPERPGAGN